MKRTAVKSKTANVKRGEK